MLFDTLTERGATPALVKSMAFQEARLATIAENVANVGTPHYRAKQLDSAAFERALHEAMQDRGRNYDQQLDIKSGHQVDTADNGLLQITPTEQPVENVMFHDGTNLSIEKQMSELARTGMKYELAGRMLASKYQVLRKAIRGRA